MIYVILEIGSDWVFNGEYSEEIESQTVIGYVDTKEAAAEYVTRDFSRFTYCEAEALT